MFHPDCNQEEIMKFTKTILMLSILLAGLLMIMPVSADPVSYNVFQQATSTLTNSYHVVQVVGNANVYTTDGTQVTQIVTANANEAYSVNQIAANVNIETSGDTGQKIEYANINGATDSNQITGNVNYLTTGDVTQWATTSMTGSNQDIQINGNLNIRDEKTPVYQESNAASAYTNGNIMITHNVNGEPTDDDYTFTYSIVTNGLGAIRGYLPSTPT
jgi:hypothetical protein